MKPRAVPALLLLAAMCPWTSVAGDGTFGAVREALKHQDYHAALDTLEICIEEGRSDRRCSKVMRKVKTDCIENTARKLDNLPAAALLPTYNGLSLLDRCLDSSDPRIIERKEDARALVSESRARAQGLVDAALSDPLLVMKESARLNAVGAYDPAIAEALQTAIQRALPSLSSTLDRALLDGEIEAAESALALWRSAQRTTNLQRGYVEKLRLATEAMARAAIIRQAMEEGNLLGASETAREIDQSFVPRPVQQTIFRLNRRSADLLDAIAEPETIQQASVAIKTAESLLVTSPSPIADELARLHKVRSQLLSSSKGNTPNTWREWPALMMLLLAWEPDAFSKENLTEIGRHLAAKYPKNIVLRVKDNSQGHVRGFYSGSVEGTQPTTSGLPQQTYWLVEYELGPCDSEVENTGSKLVESSYRAGYDTVDNPDYVRAVAAYNEAVRKYNLEAGKSEPNPYLLPYLEGAANGAYRKVQSTSPTVRVPVNLSYMVEATYYQKTWACAVDYRVSQSGRTFTENSNILSRTEKDYSLGGVRAADLAGLSNRTASFTRNNGYAMTFGQELREAVEETIAFLSEGVWLQLAREHAGGDEPWHVNLEATGLVVARALPAPRNALDRGLVLIERYALTGELDHLGEGGRNPVSALGLDAGLVPHQGSGAVLASSSEASKDHPVSHQETPRRFAGKLEAVRKNVCVILTPAGHGSGVVIAPWGILVTNEHVVEGYDEVRVRFADGTEKVGLVVARDPGRDLAALRVGLAADLSGIYLKSTRDVLIGEEANAVGAPLEPESLSWSLTRGIVSQVRSGYPTLIQTDTPINRGNSGGPLTDHEGKVLGIVVLKFSRDSAEGLAFAISSDDVRAFLDEVAPR